MNYYKNKLDGYYDNFRIEMLKFLPAADKIALDLGCGNGAFASLVKKKKCRSLGNRIDGTGS